MGHTTHGLQLAGAYLDRCPRRADAGHRRARGGDRRPRPTLLWDGRYLPGLWLTDRAVGEAIARARAVGIGAVSIRRSHHIGCLAVFLSGRRAQGLMAIVASSDPSVVSVAPYGGSRPVMTPNPMAIGIPTDGDPILIDISASITTNGLSNRMAAEGRRAPQAWYVDADGQPTDDPAVINAEPPGAILPIGGTDHGHKGYGLGLTIEALTQGLAASAAPTRRPTGVPRSSCRRSIRGVRRPRRLSPPDRLAGQSRALEPPGAGRPARAVAGRGRAGAQARRPRGRARALYRHHRSAE